MFRRIWGSPRARIITSAAVVAVLLGAGGVVVAAEAARAEARAEVEAAYAEAVTARVAAADARRVLGLAMADVDAQLAAIEDLDSDKLTEVFGDSATVLDDTVAAAREHLDAAKEWQAPAVDRTIEPDEALSAADAKVVETWGGLAGYLDHVRADWRRAEAGYRDATLLLARGEQIRWGSDGRPVAVDKVVDVRGALEQLGSQAPAVAAAVLEAAPLADEASRAAVTDAAAALEGTDDPVEAIAPFLAAVDAVKKAHAAEEARLAEEAARAAQESSGGSGRRGGSGGSPSTGGGGGAPSTGGGGSPGGGGSTPPVDTRRYADPRGPYTPGCALGGMLYAADPGPGGTSVIASVTIPYDFRIEGNLVKVYACR